MNSIEASIRNTKTKGEINSLRQKGEVPAIVYGGTEENQTRESQGGLQPGELPSGHGHRRQTGAQQQRLGHRTANEQAAPGVIRNQGRTQARRPHFADHYHEAGIQRQKLAARQVPLVHHQREKTGKLRSAQEHQ